MKINTKSLIAAVLISSASSTAYAQSSCEDDPRMYRIADFVAQKAQGQVEPMEMTSETFFNLTSIVRTALGDDILVLDADCKGAQVLQGAPAFSVEVPFASYYNSIHDAVVRDDAKAIEMILTSFRPEPVDLEYFITMLAAINTPSIVRSKIAASIGVAEYDQNSLTDDNTNCNDPVKFLTYADVFTAGGGVIDNRKGPSVLAIGKNAAFDMVTFPGRFYIAQPSTGALGRKRCSLDAGHVSALAAKAGFSVFPYPNSRLGENDIAAIEAWIASRQPGDDTPLDVSIFQ